MKDFYVIIKEKADRMLLIGEMLSYIFMYLDVQNGVFYRLIGGC